MPELAFMFSVGSLASLLTALAFAYTQLAKYKSKSYLQLQQNLAQLKLRYSDIESSVQKINSEVLADIENEVKLAQKKEISRAKTTYSLFGFAAVILSWLGFLFLVLMWFSVAKLVRNRLEEALFDSQLAQSALSAEQANKAWLEIKSLGFDS